MDTFLTFNELMILMRGDIKQNVPVALFSRPGTGKSSFLKSLADKLKTEVFTIAINQIADKADLTGVRLVDKVDENGAKYYQQEAFPHATLMEAIRYAEANPDRPAIIFLDEFNRTTPDVTSATLSFTTERKIGTIAFPDNVRFVLAGNKEGNVIPFDDATATRFAIYDVRPDHNTFLEVNPNLNAFLKDMIVDNKGYLLGEAVAGIGKNAPNNAQNPYLNANSGQAQAPAGSDEDDVFDVFEDDSAITKDRTVPRTLSMLSDWLNGENLDKSGSADEQAALTEYLQEVEYSHGGSQRLTLLQVAIESKIGQTDTAQELVRRIMEYRKELDKLANASITNANGQSMTKDFQAILNEIRPSQESLDALEQASTRDELVDIVGGYTSESLSNGMLWLLTNDSYQTLIGNVSASDLMKEIAKHITKLDTRSARLFNQIIGNPDQVVKRSLQLLKEHIPTTNTTMLSLVSFAETTIG